MPNMGIAWIVNGTLVRTLPTSVTILLSLAALMFFGNGAIFVFGLFIGVIVGIYASIFIAPPVVLAIHHETQLPAATTSAAPGKEGFCMIDSGARR